MGVCIPNRALRKSDHNNLFNLILAVFTKWSWSNLRRLPVARFMWRALLRFTGPSSALMAQKVSKLRQMQVWLQQTTSDLMMSLALGPSLYKQESSLWSSESSSWHNQVGPRDELRAFSAPSLLRGAGRWAPHIHRQPAQRVSGRELNLSTAKERNEKELVVCCFFFFNFPLHVFFHKAS